MYEVGAQCLCWQGAELFITKASAYSTTRCTSTCEGCLWQKLLSTVWSRMNVRKCSFCCSSKWLFPEETALACMCWFYQQVPNRYIYLYIAQPLPNWSFLTFRPFFSFFLLHHLSCVLHMVTQPWASTQYSREQEIYCSCQIKTPKVCSVSVQLLCSLCGSNVAVSG